MVKAIRTIRILEKERTQKRNCVSFTTRKEVVIKERAVTSLTQKAIKASPTERETEVSRRTEEERALQEAMATKTTTERMRKVMTKEMVAGPEPLSHLEEYHLLLVSVLTSVLQTPSVVSLLMSARTLFP